MLPKYLAQQWAKASGRGEVGKLRIVKNQGKTEVSFTLNEELASIQDIGGKPASSFVTAPREHPFQLQNVGGQTLTVFTESLSEMLVCLRPKAGCAHPGIVICIRTLIYGSAADLLIRMQQPHRRMSTVEFGSGDQQLVCISWSVVGPSDEKLESRTTEKMAIEGIVVQRAECRPAASEHYMQMKRRQIEESSKPKRQSQQIEKAVTTNYKPVSNHANNIEYEKKKKDDGKRARADKQQVLDMLFSAFEKHQYYNLKDLVDITKQPVSYLKDILRDICIHNVKGTHKNTWELKPEYRHYQGEDKSD
ncbi:general transcription factor IIF subunit 2 isoform X2 [Dendrobates tinctorius]|uniref:general transcription factor IIF subunit 2 isoform X2 n=1 Tax=Dendrobates tinctorius TaxID=92724 RepID=UPI003CC9AB39